jgi:hypothetical protein
MIFLDSSALVKRYVEETGSTQVTTMVAEAEAAAVSRLAYAEVLSAITLRFKGGDISRRSLDKIKPALKADWERLIIIELRNPIWSLADRLIADHGLKASDSIHLSSALWLKQTLKTDLIFVASGVELLAAAQREKLKTTNPQGQESLLRPCSLLLKASKARARRPRSSFSRRP